MRKLIYFTMAPLDGFTEDTGRGLDWMIIDEELHTYVNQLKREIGAYLEGRRSAGRGPHPGWPGL